MKRLNLVAACVLIGLLSWHSTAAQREAAPPPPDAAQPSPEEAKRQEAWRESMLQIPKPKNGCFKATYPKTEWQEVPCTATPPYPQSSARAPELLSLAAADARQQATPPPPPEQVSPEEAKNREAWHESMLQIPKPRKGCFNANYPNKEWREVPCAPTPSYPQPPRRGPRPLIVGNGDDVAAQRPTAGSFISTATGSFDSVTSVTSESGPIGNTGPSVANAYTLQLNTNFFASSVCPVTSTACQGWQQFVFENNGSTGRVYIQYWLLRFNAPCPAGQNWNQFSFTGETDIYCWKNNSAGAASAGNQPITNLGQLRLTGIVSATADSVSLSTGTTISSVTGDNAVAASAGWTVAEFNVFGDGGNSDGGGMASFNTGASIVPRTRITYGGVAAPNCVAQGFTAETNNLSFGATAPGTSPPGPAVFFTESIAGGATSNCAAATAVGDTHLRTLSGLFYDFQASGDFILAQVDPDFMVQTRQVSGAPTWPDASVNSAVATRFGKTQLALCAAPAGRDTSARLFVDGTATNLADGQSLALPDEVNVVRQGNVYVMSGQTGDSVRAVVNSNYIDVKVGLGRWPANVRGLIANPNGNVNQLEARDGTVLTNPFAFDDLYRRFGDSWRVPANESLLSVCGVGESGIPRRVFYANNLDENVRTRARAVCTAAGVKTGPLLDACTLDVAVIGRDQAAQVFVGALEPVAVGTIVGTTGTGLGLWMWLLIALVILLVLLLLWKLLK